MLLRFQRRRAVWFVQRMMRVVLFQVEFRHSFIWRSCE